MRLSIQVRRARNLPSKDKNGFSDPFVVLQHKGQNFRTEIRFKTLNPEWNEECLFISDIAPDTHVLPVEIDVYDHDDVEQILGDKLVQGRRPHPVGHSVSTEANL